MEFIKNKGLLRNIGSAAVVLANDGRLVGKLYDDDGGFIVEGKFHPESDEVFVFPVIDGLALRIIYSNGLMSDYEVSLDD